jgi:hypothetical protein
MASRFIVLAHGGMIVDHEVAAGGNYFPGRSDRKNMLFAVRDR